MFSQYFSQDQYANFAVFGASSGFSYLHFNYGLVSPVILHIVAMQCMKLQPLQCYLTELHCLTLHCCRCSLIRPHLRLRSTLSARYADL